MTFDAVAVHKVQTQINRAIWVCAGIAMTASAIAGVTGFWKLQGDGWGLASGLMSSLTVDVALWVALTGDRLMESIGLTADGPWARAIRWGTAIMSIILNVLAAVLSALSPAKKILLILIHAFAPMVMVGLAELRGENARKLEAARRAAELTLGELEHAKPLATVVSSSVSPGLDARETQQPMASVVEHTPASPSAHLQRSLHPTAQPPTVTPLRFRSAPKASASPTPVRDQAFAWLDEHHGPATTATTLAAGINGSSHTCKKLLAEWRKQNRKQSQEVAS